VVASKRGAAGRRCLRAPGRQGITPPAHDPVTSIRGFIVAARALGPPHRGPCGIFVPDPRPLRRIEAGSVTAPLTGTFKLFLVYLAPVISVAGADSTTSSFRLETGCSTQHSSPGLARIIRS